MGDSASAKDLEINEHYHPTGAGEDPARLKSAFLRGSVHFWSFFDVPVTWFRKNIVEPNQKKYPWYHQQFRRVPTIDKCYVGDEVCMYEANMQFKRDRLVDTEIINILRYRMDDCVREEYPDYQQCFPLKEAYEVASAAWFQKYGELGADFNVRKAFMKQKHRLLWERRHGPVGSGMRCKDSEVSAEAEDH